LAQNYQVTALVVGLSSSHHITWWRRTQTRRPLYPKNTL